ncbi:PREDICTED: probable G-protein coupled receptor [Priapulus caudatus]|uniref:Probable G-protein coupled receptor n=1 Tax=Priapulus caudatus TaxID=37621 RepID=A0ABM1EIC8_PRICU|nr:PREDICTED: probable G-protein coupled receptor [Priapulus caudatus]
MAPPLRLDNETTMTSVENATYLDDVTLCSVETSSPAQVVVVVFMSIVNVTVLVLNLSVLVTVLAAAQLRATLTNIILGNLFVIDILAGVLLIPLSILHHGSPRWLLAAPLCDANAFLTSLLTFASALSLALISCERFYSIAYPMSHAANVTLPKTRAAVGALWAAACVCALPPLAGWGRYEYRPCRGHCSLAWDAQTGSYMIAVSVVCFAAPACIIVSMYVAIFHVAKRATTRVKPTQQQHPRISIISASAHSDVHGPRKTQPSATPASAEPPPGETPPEGATAATRCLALLRRLWRRRNAQKNLYGISSNPWKAAKTLTLVTAFFLLFWGPFFIVNLCGLASSGHLANQQLAEALSAWLTYVGFAMNAVLYGFLNRQIREEALRRARGCVRRLRGLDDDVEDFLPCDGEDFFQFLERTSLANPPAQPSPTPPPIAASPDGGAAGGSSLAQQQAIMTASALPDRVAQSSFVSMDRSEQPEEKSSDAAVGM